MTAEKNNINSIRPWRTIERRKSRKIMVGSVPVGGDAPIAVQSMTNTITHNIPETLKQIHELEAAGADIVRVSVPDIPSSAAMKEICNNVSVPIVADIHFHYKRGIEAADNGVSCLRINPGNIGGQNRVKEIVAAAKANNCSIRIGVNGGSLEKELLEKYGEPCPDAMVDSALMHAQMLEDENFDNYKISVKASDIFLTMAAYQKLADCTDAPLHLGVTEAGGKRIGSVKSSIGMGSLLWAGIGDTIRVSLSDEPEEEVKVGFEILKSLGVRNRGVKIVSCPSCARQQFQVIDLVKKLENSLEDIINPLTVSIIGCVVNGPGEANMTNIGITGGGNNTHMIYVDGKKDHIVKEKDLAPYLEDLIRKKANDKSLKQ